MEQLVPHGGQAAAFTCQLTGKAAYRSKRSCRTAHQASPDRLRVYVCKEGCGLYHATNDEKNRPFENKTLHRRRKRFSRQKLQSVWRETVGKLKP